jgi:hypothetical protein
VTPAAFNPTPTAIVLAERIIETQVSPPSP